MKAGDAGSNIADKAICLRHHWTTRPGLSASAVTVLLHTNRHEITAHNGQPAGQYHGSHTTELPHAGNSAAELASYAHALLKILPKFGYKYQNVRWSDLAVH